MVVLRIFRRLNNVIEDAAVATRCNLPVDRKFEIAELPCRHQRATDISGTFSQAFTFANDHSVFHNPKWADRVGVVALPAVECLSVKQQLPASRGFSIR